VKQHQLTYPTLVLLIASIGIGVAGCSTPKEQQVQITPIPANSFMVVWQAPLELSDDPIASLHVRQSTLFAYTRSNRGMWLGAEGGQFLAVNQITSPNLTAYPPVVLDDQVVIPTTTSLESFNAAGKRIRSHPVDAAIQSPGAGQGESIFVGVSHPGTGRMAKFDLDGELNRDWELYTWSGISAAPAIYSGVVFAAGLDGRVWAITTNRSAIWALDGFAFQTAGGITADLVADESGLYVASQDKKLYALERSSGKIKWQYFAGMPLVDAPVVIDNVIYQLVPVPTDPKRLPSRQLVAINKTEGLYNREPLWVQPGVTKVLSVDDQYVYVLSGESTIVALDKTTGQAAFQSTRGDLRVFATNLGGPMIYAATADGTVLAIRPVLRPGSTGQLVQNPTGPRAFFASAK
jgi:hypothetical protein